MTGILEDMPEPEHGDLQRLGDRVRAERMERKWSKEAAARHAQINSITWDRVERGMPKVQDTKYAAIAAAFGWTADSCYRIMRNLEPEPLDETDEYEDVTEQVSDEEVRRLRAAFEEEGVLIDALTETDLRLVAAYAKAAADKNAADGNGDDTDRRAG